MKEVAKDERSVRVDSRKQLQVLGFIMNQSFYDIYIIVYQVSLIPLKEYGYISMASLCHLLASITNYGLR